jgi:drug/metabolite transporter (DMT)-like permease
VQWWWVLVPGLLLFGYVVTWYHALRHAPATVVTCVLTLGAPITALLNGLYVTHRIAAEPLAGGLLLALGSLLLAGALSRTAPRRVVSYA